MIHSATHTIVMSLRLLILAALFCAASVKCQKTIKILIVIEKEDSKVYATASEAIPSAESTDFKIEVSQAEVDRTNVDGSFEQVCSNLYSGVSIILDMTWTGWDKVREAAESAGIIYKRGIPAIQPFIQCADELMSYKNATDAGLIFETEKELNESLYYLIGNSVLRLVIIDEFTDKTVTKIQNMRPSPSYYIILATTPTIDKYFETAIKGNLVKRDQTWNIVVLDNNWEQSRYLRSSDPEKINASVARMTMKNEICCAFQTNGEQKECTCSPTINIYDNYIKKMMDLLVNVAKESDLIDKLDPKTVDCKDLTSKTSNNDTAVAFESKIAQKLNETKWSVLTYQPAKQIVAYAASINLANIKNGVINETATWTKSSGKFEVLEGQKIEPAKRYFRVGTAESLPWSLKKRDAAGNEVKDDEGKLIWTGYCIDFIHELSVKMNFDYDIVEPKDGTFGSKQNGQWNGCVGDLAKGETDFIVGALTMTSEREEVIDFVAPYFEQSGILIVMRNPVRKTSLFKFMTVLRLEVWLSIVCAITMTGVMIWLLDKYSPYSARNNKKLYPYPCREFTLKESFWFTLTSFTPQGGGEAPKSLSSRTLVAAYWLFVVLMLATFTANLAAFLTVERMQSPVQSLEQLARQSRINYTVVSNSSVYQYFSNMKSAEDKLYEVWKELTLNSSSDEVQYRVWDYPIKEQYGHILQAINQVGPVASVDEGFQKVIESENAEFAFIHDSSRIKYAVASNCNLTEVGEVFAEQPYAIAVQQGSHLQEEISRRILDLQKDRFFETLSGKFWNQSLKGSCPNADDNEGITLESLGGVFIATLFGLGMAMVILAFEVFYYKKRNLKEGQKKPQQIMVMPKQSSGELSYNDKEIFEKLTSRLQMRPAPVGSLMGKNIGSNPNNQVKVSTISVYPRKVPMNSLPFKD